MMQKSISIPLRSHTYGNNSASSRNIFHLYLWGICFYKTYNNSRSTVKIFYLFFMKHPFKAELTPR